MGTWNIAMGLHRPVFSAALGPPKERQGTYRCLCGSMEQHEPQQDRNRVPPFASGYAAMQGLQPARRKQFQTRAHWDCKADAL